MEDVAFLLSETSNLNSDCPRQSHSLRLKKQCVISYGQERRNRCEGPRKTQVSGEVCHQSTRNGKTKAVDSGAKIGSTTKTKHSPILGALDRGSEGGGRGASRVLGPPFFAPAPTTGTSDQLHQSGRPPGPPPPCLQGQLPGVLTWARGSCWARTWGPRSFQWSS